VIDWQVVEEARAFAERWHRGRWSVEQLPSLMGWRIIQRDLDPILLGGTKATTSGQIIYLHERLAGAAYVGVLAHECAHPFDAAEGETAFCSSLSGFAPQELRTNVIASVLAVPLTAAREIHLDDDSSTAAAESLCVPRQMVRIRRALAVALGEIPGRRDHALHSLNSASIGLAAYFWRVSLRLAASDPLAPYYTGAKP